MAKPKWSDAVREQREGPAPEPEARKKHGRCECGCGRFGLGIRERKLIRTCKECGEEQAM